jgi:hypothetical protein
MDPENRTETGSSFGTSPAKTQQCDGMKRRGDGSRGRRRFAGLLDGDGEPSDQQRYFVEMFKIVFLEGSGEPPQALIIAHQGNIGRHDRGHRFQDGLDVWHRITSVQPGMQKLVGD